MFKFNILFTCVQQRREKQRNKAKLAVALAARLPAPARSSVSTQQHPSFSVLETRLAAFNNGQRPLTAKGRLFLCVCVYILFWVASS